jgi:hypothetical protein
MQKKVQIHPYGPLQEKMLFIWPPSYSIPGSVPGCKDISFKSKLLLLISLKTVEENRYGK